MAKTIDWMYSRKSCVTCQRAQAFLDERQLKPAEVTDARKIRMSPAEALKLAKTMDRVVVSKGPKTVAFDMVNDPPDDATLAAHLIGPTGNMRAPAVKIGRTLSIGFNSDAYAALLK